jgi:hypothetical protein
MKTKKTLKELVTQFLVHDIISNPQTYAEYIAEQMEKRGTLEDYLDIPNRSLEIQEEIVTRLGFDPRTKNPLETLLEEAIQKELGLKEASANWLKARLNTKDKTQIRRGVEKLCHTIRWSTGGELQEKHLVWFKKAKKALL